MARIVPVPPLRGALRAKLHHAIGWNLGIILLCSLILLLCAITLPAVADGHWTKIIDLALVAGFAGLVAYGELVSRYHDSPARLLGAPPTPLYIIVNAAAGIAAWLIVDTTEVLKDSGHRRLFEIMLSSFAAIAFFRTSFFTVRVGGTDIGVGPSAVLQSLLSAADRMLDRDQAEGRATDVAEIMREVDFKKAQIALTTLCFTLVQNLSPEDQKGLSDQIKALAEAGDISDEARSVILGVYLIRQVGADVLDHAVQALGDQILRETPRVVAASDSPPSGVAR